MEKNLFLCSSFEDVATLFKTHMGAQLTGKRVTFIPTAAIPEEVDFYIHSAKQLLTQLGLMVDELELTTAAAEEITRKLEGCDFIYVSGGNTFFLLEALKKTGADQLIIRQVEQGTVYIGESAGSIITAPNIAYVSAMDDCTAAPGLSDTTALGLVDFYPLPHHTNEPFKEAAEQIIAQYADTLKLIPITNDQAIIVSPNGATII